MRMLFITGTLAALLGLCCVSGGGASPPVSPVAIAISPPLLRFQTGAGGVTRFKITVANQGRDPVRVEAMTRDLTLAPDGTPLVGARGEDRWSCAAWIAVEPGWMDLGPEGSREVNCTLRVPRAVTGGRYAAVLFRAENPRAPVGSGLRVDARVGTVVMQAVPRTGRPNGEVAAIRAIPTAKGADLAVDVRNTGNVDLKASGSAVVFDAGGRVVGRVRLEGGTGTVLPDGVRTLAGRWAPLRPAPGDYVVEARIVLPGRGIVRGRGAFVASKPEVKSQ